jgi:hypothetical protein
MKYYNGVLKDKQNSGHPISAAEDHHTTDIQELLEHYKN